MQAIIIWLILTPRVNDGAIDTSTMYTLVTTNNIYTEICDILHI